MCEGVFFCLCDLWLNFDVCLIVMMDARRSVDCRVM